MVVKVPTLTPQGFVTNIADKADKLFAYYLASEYSQSQVYYGKITSLPYHIQTYGNNRLELESIVRSDLQLYFNRYFDDVVLDIRTDIDDPTDPNKLNLTIEVTVTEDGKRYSLGKQIQAANNKVIKIFDLINGGVDELQ